MSTARFIPAESLDLQPIPAISAVREIHTHLSMALAPHAMKVGDKVDALDYEHLQQAFAIASLLLMVSPSTTRKETFPEFWDTMGKRMTESGEDPRLIAQCAWHAGIAGGR